jgi:hypothetical protein
MGLRQLIERLVTSQRYSMHQIEAVVPGRATTSFDEQRGPCCVLLRYRVFKDEVKQLRNASTSMAYLITNANGDGFRSLGFCVVSHDDY